MKTSHFKLLVLAVVVFIASIVTARTISQHRFVGSKTNARATDSGYTSPVYDKAVLAQFQALCHKYDSVGSHYTVAGSLSVRDLTDTTGTLKDVPFLCCKNGGELYYRLGRTETINGGGLYIFIDHQAKTILLSKQKDVITNANDQIIPDFGKQLASEDYALSRKAFGGKQTFSLINEHHVSCKEYSLTADSATGKITRIRTRLSNAQEPLRKDNEKLIDVEFSRWDGAGELKSYTNAADVVRRNGNDWLPTKDYLNYQLIKM